jgi:hypothetical protein
MARMNQHHDLPEEALPVLERSLNLESCLEFRSADVQALLKHVNEGRCEQCLTFFRAMEQRAKDKVTTAPGVGTHANGGDQQKPGKVPAMNGKSSLGISEDRLIDRWLLFEYVLIPKAQRPLVGSNDWFRWLDEFQQRHPVEVSRLSQPVAKRAAKVLWNS